MERERYRHDGPEGNPFWEHAPWLEIVAALDWLPLATLVLTSDGTALGANQAWAALSAVPVEVARGEGWLRIVEPRDREPLRARLREAAAVGETGCADFRLARAQGGCWSRWWWRPGPAGRLITCVTDLNEGPPLEAEGTAVAIAAATGFFVASSPSDTAEELIARAHLAEPSAKRAKPAGPSLPVRLLPLPPAPPAEGRGGDSEASALRACGQAAGIDAGPGLAEMVVHRLFRVGLTLQSAAGLADGPIAARLQQAVDELDTIIRDVRTAAFGRHGRRRAQD